MASKLLISSHNDDSELFAAYTMLREKPLILVVTDSFIQFNRGDHITWLQRRQESEEATKILGCSVVFGAIPDTELDASKLDSLFRKYKNFDKVYIPAAIDNGNEQHNLINKIALKFWPNAIQYMSYSKTNLLKMGRIEIEPTPEEIELKNKALDCYVSQINLGATRPHFDAVRGRSEWYE